MTTQTKATPKSTKPPWTPTIKPVTNSPGVYTCTSSRYPDLQLYEVDTIRQTCTCPALTTWAHPTCRHLRAVADYIERRNQEALHGLRDRAAEERLQALVREHGGAAGLLSAMGVDLGEV